MAASNAWIKTLKTYLDDLIIFADHINENEDYFSDENKYNGDNNDTGKPSDSVPWQKSCRITQKVAVSHKLQSVSINSTLL